jgi:hypothetical protein
VLVAVFTVVGGGAAASSRAAAETAPAGCGTAGACPATAHQYVWHGLICATVPHAYAGIDTIEVRLGATSWLCHSSRTLPWHRAIVATTFWVGEVVDGALSDGSQVCSAYDRDWAYHWSGVDDGTVSATTRACSGSIIGGCDGVTEANGVCSTQARTAANGYFPTRAHPRENPFYADLPFDDVNDPVAFAERCQVIPWAYAPGFAGHCTDRQFSYMKNHWLRIVGPDGRTCYGQIEDAGPSHGHLYHDALYVFGAIDARPLQGGYNDTGIDVSPALNGCLGFAALDGDHDHVSWQFVAATSVPAGPWRRLITTRQVFAP